MRNCFNFPAFNANIIKKKSYVYCKVVVRRRRASRIHFTKSEFIYKWTCQRQFIRLITKSKPNWCNRSWIMHWTPMNAISLHFPFSTTIERPMSMVAYAISTIDTIQVFGVLIVNIFSHFLPNIGNINKCRWQFSYKDR